MGDHQVILTKKARSNLKAIGLFIARDNHVRAVSFIIELQEFLDTTLSYFPHSGRLFDNILGQEVRTIPYQNYVSIYTVNSAKKQVNIVHIFNAAMDKDAILQTIAKKL